MDEVVSLKMNGQVAVLTLNRPDKLNALDPSMRERLPQLLRQLQGDDAVRVVILTGAGRGFCSGADLAGQRAEGEREPRSRQERLQLTAEFIQCFATFDKPMIAAVNGVAAGVGLTLALACDLRIASDRARFSAIWVRRGLIADGGATLLLPLIVGLDRALELALTGDVLNATQAADLRLVSRVVPHDTLLPDALELARKIAAQPPITVELIKKIMLQDVRKRWHEQLMLESYAQNLCRGTDDQKEAVRAFLEKRLPVFTGS